MHASIDFVLVLLPFSTLPTETLAIGSISRIINIIFVSITSKASDFRGDLTSSEADL
jgi:hypothetical protein